MSDRSILFTLGALNASDCLRPEPHLFITDPNQSPFNVGTKLELKDFSIEHAIDLNERYGSPLADETDVSRYCRLVGGHPYLLHSGIFEMKRRGLTLSAFEAVADDDEGPFGDHLTHSCASRT
jgi:hypothetical protein